MDVRHDGPAGQRLLAGLFFVPRSPRWLAAKGHYDEALGVLASINGSAAAERELEEIREELGEETGEFRELLRPGVAERSGSASC